MRFAIIGSGGVGGLLGGLLARAGGDVAFLARGDHLRALRERGLRVDGALGAFTISPVVAADDPRELGPAEVVLVAVKGWQVRELAPALRPLLGPGTAVLPLENGIEAAAELARALGDEHVLGGLCHMLSWIEGPGHIRLGGKKPSVTLGERAGGSSPRVEAIAAALRGAGVDVVVAADVETALWEKFLFIEPFGAVGAVTRAPVGVVRQTRETRELLVAAMEEIARLGRARRVKLPDDAVARALELLERFPPDATASMQRDIQAGRPSELHDQTGAVVRMAREASLPAPVHAFLHASLLPQEAAARRKAGLADSP